MRVYDPEGNAHDIDAVDARECVQHCGYSYQAPAAVVADAEPNVNKRDKKTEAD